MLIFHLISWCGNFGILLSVFQILRKEVATYKKRFCLEKPLEPQVFSGEKLKHNSRIVVLFTTSLTNH